ncbi:MULTISPECIES: polyribonucleotide nucleotidyltransferase [Acidobacterium]|uniref:Polyribonucleotide nucleotidyltransferase n=1 Tax=Acidobacterium capsulatum (strain ATCC 51196 / DSM 11244 / BCRC 80197 / JCM 7670 / NBRC 15755 / NCIMB 13165 / 161) TaxID=240015 RepID=PNP_ACIC5|nr:MULTISPECIES: polyribonucleotide nucleotidyltransferase [Acidobacterium]C1F8M1.1 RecName: Full=Polyribonucleotide nucleotidyltransferase; AltName: Full=Polynucleotide phosphorylase; Short=PNPase [Acidobacterium capsulatum ATCC 51196]ACO32008.1 polyribonucleotide nucleotidyltransferase [Acidobacterium capsulatum ATCC 51196]HCT61521.1 polyribonucleotide nucleotidyltransferase [Acidobacterium sp.]
MKQDVTVELTGGKKLHFETGRMAKQASGAALVTQGESVVLATAVAAPDPKEGIDFFPLTVDYREYAYAGGRIPGGFIKREGRPSEREILTSRQIDRPIRPLFPEGFRNETQVIALVFSADKENDPDIVGINAASAALALSDIPFAGPVGAVRVGYVNGEYVINPSYAERRDSSINITVVGTMDGIVMIESGSAEVPEEVVLGAIDFGHTEIKKIVAAINELAAKAGKTKRAVTAPEFDEAYFETLKNKIGARLADALDTKAHPKTESYALVKQIKDELAAEIPADENAGAAKKKLAHYYELLREKIFREQVTKDRVRPDRRGFDEIRQITIEVGVLPRTHGSALFTRGETQALVTATLGTNDDSQRLETFEGEQKKRFMLHYNFPPFSVGEVGRMTGVGRREVGHGALAERAISAVLPGEDESPYALRVVSDILESNGSSSMASVCGASLALMDAGIPLKGAVAGVAMGLVKEGDEYAILTDIAGAEDHYGDMDFKVAGTRKGITALQMDIKISGITGQIMREAMEQARRGRMFLLDKMDEILAAPREEKSKHAPQIRTVQIPTDKIRDLIGPGGKTIRGIIEATQVKIDVDDTGRVNIASSDEEGLKKALAMINDLTAVPEVGKTYLGKVVRLAEFGAFVEIFPGTDGLLHISEIAEHRVKEVKDELHEGDQVMVKVLGVEGNRIKLSRKAVIREQRQKLGLPEPGAEAPAAAEGQPRAERAERQPSSNASTITIEGGEDFDDFDEEGGEGEGEDENFNREDTPNSAPGERRPGGAGAAGNRGRRRRRGRGRGPGQGGGGNRGPQ